MQESGFCIFHHKIPDTCHALDIIGRLLSTSKNWDKGGLITQALLFYNHILFYRWSLWIEHPNLNHLLFAASSNPFLFYIYIYFYLLLLYFTSSAIRGFFRARLRGGGIDPFSVKGFIDTLLPCVPAPPSCLLPSSLLSNTILSTRFSAIQET